MFKSRKLHKMKIYGHGLSTLLMQNPYSKFILDIKTLSADEFVLQFADPVATNWDLGADKKIFLLSSNILDRLANLYSVILR